MTYPRALILSLVAASTMATACGFQHTGNVLVPDPVGTRPSTPAPSTALVGTWTSQSFTVPPPSGCSNFQWRVTSQTATAAAGTFEADCAGSMTVTGTAQGQLITATTVALAVNGTANLPQVSGCAFSLSGTGTVEDNGNTLRIPYAGTTCLGPVHGTEVLRKAASASPAPAPVPPPAPTPAPQPPPAPSPSPSSPDAIDLRQATILNSPADVASWPATATLTRLDLGTNGAYIEFTRRDGPGSWPDVPFGDGGSLEYTLWIVLNIHGHWYASGCIEFWRGLDRNGGPPAEYSLNWYYDPIRWGPMAGYQPAPGEPVGFLVTAGDARNNGLSYVHERSNVVAVPFPGGNGGVYSFALDRALGLTRGR